MNGVLNLLRNEPNNKPIFVENNNSNCFTNFTSINLLQKRP